jgi:futalosine hydrolase
MQILVVAATEMEIAPFLMKHPAADHLITGIGSAISIYHIGKRLHQIDYDLVIQAGIAGSFSEKLALGEVVFAVRDTFADLGIREKGIFSNIFAAGLTAPGDFPFINGWLINNYAGTLPTALKEVTAITVNTVSDDHAYLNQLKEQYDAEIESMEGAALHYVCLQENIPFLQIRSISNYIGERDKSKWKLKEAISHLNDELLNIYDRLLLHSVN